MASAGGDLAGRRGLQGPAAGGRQDPGAALVLVRGPGAYGWRGHSFLSPRGQLRSLLAGGERCARESLGDAARAEQETAKVAWFERQRGRKDATWEPCQCASSCALSPCCCWPSLTWR